jgi:hypothetical protein
MHQLKKHQVHEKAPSTKHRVKNQKAPSEKSKSTK